MIMMILISLTSPYFICCFMINIFDIKPIFSKINLLLFLLLRWSILIIIKPVLYILIIRTMSKSIDSSLGHNIRWIYPSIWRSRGFRSSFKLLVKSRSTLCCAALRILLLELFIRLLFCCWVWVMEKRRVRLLLLLFLLILLLLFMSLILLVLIFRFINMKGLIRH